MAYRLHFLLEGNLSAWLDGFDRDGICLVDLLGVSNVLTKLAVLAWLNWYLNWYFIESEHKRNSDTVLNCKSKRWWYTCGSNTVHVKYRGGSSFTLSKPFDHVPHHQRMEWKVVINGAQSECCKVINCVPQGSALGPTIIYINDIEFGVMSSVLKCADDTKVFRRLSTSEDAFGLQKDLRSWDTYIRHQSMQRQSRVPT